MDKIFDYSEYDFSEYISKNEVSIDYYEDMKHQQIENLEIRNYPDQKDKIFKDFEYCFSIKKLLEKFYQEIVNQKKQIETLKKEKEQVETEKNELKRSNNQLTEKVKKLEKDLKEKEKEKAPIRSSITLDSNASQKTKEDDSPSIKAEKIKLNQEIKTLKEDNTKLTEEMNKLKEQNRELTELRKYKEECSNMRQEKLKLEEQLKQYSCALYCNLSLLSENKNQNKNLLNLLNTYLNNNFSGSEQAKTIEILNETIQTLEKEITVMKEEIPKEIWELPKIHTDNVINEYEIRKIEDEFKNRINTLYSSFFKANSGILEEHILMNLVQELEKKDYVKFNDCLIKMFDQFYELINIDNFYKKLIESGRVKKCIVCGNLRELKGLKDLSCKCSICVEHQFSQFDKKLHESKFHKSN